MNIELRDLYKRFGAISANDGISLSVKAGTICGILGENGAGKSTLMKLLSGFIRADSGEILLDDQPVDIRSPAHALRHGIGMLHQDPLDFPPMRVVDNFLLASPGRLFFSRTRAAQAIRKLQHPFGFSIEPEAYIDSMTVGERQQVELLRLLWLGARVLILDEPTTGISAVQKEKLFAALRTLAGQGKTVLFVSHKLGDVESLCGRVVVLRNGRLVGDVFPPFSRDRLVELMFGKVISLGEKPAPAKTGDSALRSHKLAIETPRLRVECVDLDVHAGEIVGLAGMEGSGQGLLLRACAGLLRPVSGRLSVRGQDVTGRSYTTFLRHGINYVPASRLEEGLIAGLSLAEHFMIVDPAREWVINRARAEKTARERIAEYAIRGEPDTQVEQLSGGNQQRALLALLKDSLSVILLEQPTRGLDVESAMAIWGKLRKHCDNGMAILFVSSDLEEVLHYSDRILVFFNGKVSASLDARTMTVERLGEMIGGGASNQ